MILLALALQVAVPAPAPVILPEDDIVVIAEKLKRWRGVITTRVGGKSAGTRCVTTKSTGDAEIDRVGCTAMERCWPDILPRMEAANAKGVAKADRKRLQAEAGQAFGACAKPQRETLMMELRARRRAVRAGAGA